MKETLYPLKLYLRRKQHAILMGMALFFNLGSWIWLGIHIRPHLGDVFLHYTILFGVDLIGPWYAVFSLPLTGLLILLLNGMLGWLLFRKDPFVGYLLHVSSIIVNICILVASNLLVFLNV